VAALADPAAAKIVPAPAAAATETAPTPAAPRSTDRRETEASGFD
jgi:hypothetical protein